MRRRPPRSLAFVGTALVIGAVVAACATPFATVSQAPTPSPAPTALPSPTAAPTAAATPTPTPTSEPALVPLVPIVSFWSSQRSISWATLVGAIGGSPSQNVSPNPVRVAVSASDLPALGELLGVTPLNVAALNPDGVRTFVKSTPKALGIVRAEDVTLGVRAIGVDGLQLFGVGRVHDIGQWPLLAAEPGVATTFTTSAAWTMAAGGDVMLDKAVYARSVTDGLGADYAWNGGTASTKARYCCGWGGSPLVSGLRTGQSGALGDLFRQADLSMVNLESPEPHDFTYHADGFTFTGDPALLDGLRDSGIDVVSMANNHLGDGGLHAVADEIGTLDGLGIGHAGAGANNSAARAPARVVAGGLRVAVLAYCWIEPLSYWATSNSPGSSGFSISQVTSDIAAAKAAGADYVVVMPHWGLEYTDAVLSDQSNAAAKMIAAGADLILGSHSHWFGAMAQAGADKLVFYSFGNLVFDWTHDERTQESAVADMTFVGAELVQVDLHPILIIDGQPNLLDPAGDGKVIMDQIRATSGPKLGW